MYTHINCFSRCNTRVYLGVMLFEREREKGKRNTNELYLRICLLTYINQQKFTQVERKKLFGRTYSGEPRNFGGRDSEDDAQKQRFWDSRQNFGGDVENENPDPNRPIVEESVEVDVDSDLDDEDENLDGWEEQLRMDPQGHIEKVCVLVGVHVCVFMYVWAIGIWTDARSSGRMDPRAAFHVRKFVFLIIYFLCMYG
jgi:hypothetical protein